VDIIRVTEICAENIDATKKAKTQVDRGAGQGERRLRLNIQDSHFTTDPRSILMEVNGHHMLRKPQPMIVVPKPHNARKYCEFHKQSRHTITECRELKKAFHELADMGQIDHFFKRGLQSLHKERDLACEEL